MRRTPRLYGPSLLAAALTAPSATGQVPTQADIEAKWRALERRDAGNVTYKVEQKYRVEGKERPAFPWVVESAPTHGKAFRGADHIFVWNEQYTFVLMKKEGGGELMLHDLAVGRPEGNATFANFLKSNMYGHILRPYSFLQDDSAANMLSSGRLKISGIKAAGDAVEVRGTTDFVRRTMNRSRYDVTAVLAESDGRFRKVTARLIGADGKPGPTATWEYTYAAGDPAVVERIDYTSPQIAGSLTFSAPDKLTAAPDAFRTTFYGIPEPEGTVWKAPRGTSAYVWFLAAAALAALSVGLRWALRRRQAAADERPALPVATS